MSKTKFAKKHSSRRVSLRHLNAAASTLLLLLAGNAVAFDNVNTDADITNDGWENIDAVGATPPQFRATTLTYSFVPPSTIAAAGTIPDMANGIGGLADVTNNSLFATLDAQFTDFGGTAAWQAIVDESAQRWASMSGLTMPLVAANGFPQNWDDDGTDPDGDNGAMPSQSIEISENGQAACHLGVILAPPAGPTGVAPDCGTPVDGTGDPASPISVSGGLPGDIRIAMVNLDGAGGQTFVVIPPQQDSANTHWVRGGEIILDASENWAATENNFRFFRNTMTKAFGLALGINSVDACPAPNFRIMGAGNATSPANTAPQNFDLPIFSANGVNLPIDDVLAIQDIYLDPLTGNDFLPVPPGPPRTISTNGTTNLGSTASEASFSSLNNTPVASIDRGPTPLPAGTTGDPDSEDIYRFSIVTEPGSTSGGIDVDVVVTLTPLGDSAGPDDADAQPCDNTLDQTMNENLTFSIIDDDNNVLLGPVDNEVAGGTETGTVRVNDFGTYFVVVEFGAGTNSGLPQLYQLDVQIIDRRFDLGIEIGQWITRGESRHTFNTETISGRFGPVSYGGDSRIGEVFPVATNGHGINSFYTLPRPDGGTGFFGSGQTIALIDSGHPFDGHAVFGGRQFSRLNWGTDFTTGDPLPGFENVGNRAVTGLVSRSTGTAGVAVGEVVTAGDGAGFQGVANQANMITASVARDLLGDPVGDRFSISEEAVLFSVLGLADPDSLRLAPGGSQLPAEPVDVILNTWGIFGDLRGDGRYSLFFDWIASAYDIPIISVAGGDTGAFNGNGFIRNVSECEGGDGLVIGGLSRGYRAIYSPATAFNVISVGSIAPAVNTFPVYAYPPTDVAFADFESQIRGTPLAIDPDALLLDTVPAFAARGYTDVFAFGDGGVASNTRPGIDIVAIGGGLVTRDFNIESPPRPDNFDPCGYFAHVVTESLNIPWTSFVNDPDTGNLIVDTSQDNTFVRTNGTNVSAAVVASTFALMKEVAEANNLTTDPLVHRALIMNNARRTQHWTNVGPLPGFAQDFLNGVEVRNPDPPSLITSTVEGIPLDPFQGAGSLDAQGALDNFFLGYVFPAPTQAVVWPDYPEEPIFNASGITIDVPETDPTVPAVSIEIIPTNSGLNQNIVPDPLPGGSDSRDGVLNAGSPTRPRGDISGGGSRIPFKDGVGGGGPTGQPFTGGADAIEPTEPVLRPVFEVQPMGWDHGMIGLSTNGQLRHLIYLIDARFLPGDTLEATLVWNRTVQFDGVDFSDPTNVNFGTLSRLEFEDLALRLFEVDPTRELVDQLADADALASSDGAGTTTEKFIFNFPGTFNGFAALVVTYDGNVYDPFNNLPDGEVEFGLAWRTYPAPNRPSDTDSLNIDPVQQFIRVLLSFGTSFGSPGYDRFADANGDGQINVSDFIAILTRI